MELPKRFGIFGKNATDIIKYIEILLTLKIKNIKPVDPLEGIWNEQSGKYSLKIVSSETNKNWEATPAAQKLPVLHI